MGRERRTVSDRAAQWYLVPFRGAHKRFTRRQEERLESAWRRRQCSPFPLRVALRSWRLSRSKPAREVVFNVSLPRMTMKPAAVDPDRVEHTLRRLPAAQPGWWLPGRVSCGFADDRVCSAYSMLNQAVDAHGRPRWNASVRLQAERSGTVQRMHSMDAIREID